MSSFLCTAAERKGCIFRSCFVSFLSGKKKDKLNYKKWTMLLKK